MLQAPLNPLRKHNHLSWMLCHLRDVAFHNLETGHSVWGYINITCDNWCNSWISNNIKRIKKKPYNSFWESLPFTNPNQIVLVNICFHNHFREKPLTTKSDKISMNFFDKSSFKHLNDSTSPLKNPKKIENAQSENLSN
jgi:hypothetical protein